MKKYIEVVERKTGKAVIRMDVTSEGERGIERIKRGASINLNHSEFKVIEKVVDAELQTGDLD